MYLCEINSRVFVYKTSKSMSINEVQNEIIEEFDGLTDWMDRYAYIIELGSQMPAMEDKYKTVDNLIDGCQSRVWIEAQLSPEGLIEFEADSDAMIVKGIVALLMRVLNRRTPREVLDSDLYFIEKIGLKENLSPTRSNGLVAMLKQIRLYAVAFNALEHK